LNVAEWAIALQTGRLMEKIQETPFGLKEARTKALGFVKSLQRQAPSGARLLVGGFSQGAAMAVDLALSLEPTIDPLYLAAFSSFPVDIGHWGDRAKLHGEKLHALVTHGKNDGLIPYMASELLASVLKSNGCDVRVESHTGGHTLGDHHILTACEEFFRKVVE
jgi:predicted esterase